MLIDEFGAHLRGLQKAKATTRKYTAAARAFVGYLSTKGLTIQTAPRSALSDFSAWLGTPPNQAMPRTIELYCIGATIYLRFLRNRVDGVPEFCAPERPRAAKRMPIVLEPRQLITYLGLAHQLKEPYRIALLLLPFSGLRVQEIARLRLGDVSYLEVGAGGGGGGNANGNVGSLEATGTLEPTRLYRFRIIGKGNKQRVTPMFAGAHGLIAKQFTEYLETRQERKHDRRIPLEQRWVFPAPVVRRNLSISRQRLEKEVKKFRDEIGVPELSPHKMRATYITALLSLGIDLSETAVYVGHEKLETIHDHYAGYRYAEDEVRDMFGAFDRPMRQRHGTSQSITGPGTRWVVEPQSSSSRAKVTSRSQTRRARDGAAARV